MAQIREFCEHINQLDKLTYFRMRYRTRNAAGVDEPRDKLFVIDGDKVTHAIDMKADFPTTDLLTSADANLLRSARHQQGRFIEEQGRGDCGDSRESKSRVAFSLLTTSGLRRRRGFGGVRS